MTGSCDWCGIDLEIEYRYCSLTCANTHNKVIKHGTSLVRVTCENCGTAFGRMRGELNRTTHWFCSRSCAATLNNRRSPKRSKIVRRKICVGCGSEFVVGRRGAQGDAVKYCSSACSGKARRKHINLPEDWKHTGRVLDRAKGYVLAWKPDDPRARYGYVYEHRLVAEEMVGRRLRSDEHVHHKNGIRWGNRPENLEVMNASDHARLGGQRPEDLVI